MFAAFSTVVRALQEGQIDSENSDDEVDRRDGEEAGEQQAGEGSKESAADGEQAADGERGDGDDGEQAAAEDGVGLGNLFAFASSMAATVQQRTQEIVSTVKETDWANEIQAFKKELQEDTQTVATRVEGAIKEIPESAKNKDLQGTLLQVQSQISEIGRSLYAGTTDILNQVNDAITEEFAGGERGGGLRRGASRTSLAANRLGGAAAKYSRFEAEVSAMQRDSSTYCDEPEDAEDFAAWLATFDLGERRADIERIVADNAFMAELQARIVPLIVEYEDFWTRYFYRLHKLQVKHQQRVQVAQRAAKASAADDEEEISWDDDDDEGAPSSSSPAPAAAAAGAAAGPAAAGAAAAGVAATDSDAGEPEAAAAGKEEEGEPAPAEAQEAEAATAGADEATEGDVEDGAAPRTQEEAEPQAEEADAAADEAQQHEEGQQEQQQEEQQQQTAEPAAVVQASVDRSSGAASSAAEGEHDGSGDDFHDAEDSGSQSTGVRVPSDGEGSGAQSGAEGGDGQAEGALRVATGSDTSGGSEPWCVVSSPSKRDAEAAAAAAQQQQEEDGAAAAAGASTSAPKDDGAKKKGAAVDDDDDDVDLSDFSGDDGPGAGGDDDDDVDEDWGFD